MEAGLIFCVFSGGTGEQFIIYCVGNLFSLLAVLPLLKLGKERVRTGRYLSLLFPLLVQLLMHVGRAVMALILGAELPALVNFFTMDSLSYVFTFVIIWIARKLEVSMRIKNITSSGSMRRRGKKGGIL